MAAENRNRKAEGAVAGSYLLVPEALYLGQPSRRPQSTGPTPLQSDLGERASALTRANSLRRKHDILLDRPHVWRSVRTTSTLLKGVYQKGVKLCGKEKQELEKRLSRSDDLPWWDITIQPLMVI